MFSLHKCSWILIPLFLIACGDDSLSSSSLDSLESMSSSSEESSSSQEDRSSSSETSSSSQESMSSSSEESSSSQEDGSSSSEKSSSSQESMSSSSEESSSSQEDGSSSSEISSSSQESMSSSSEESSSSQEDGSSSSEVYTVMSIYDAENNTLTDLRDNKVYKTVTIGEQIWMAENLNYKYKAGSKSFCYNDSTKYCNLYGRLYTYDVKKVQICPEGWHLPDSVEWKNLIGENLNGALKADSSWMVWQGKSTNGTNETGFSVYAYGYKNWVDKYSALGQTALFMIKNKSRVIKITIYNSESPLFNIDGDYTAVSVRCIKDSE